jgi:hypothetical protein
MTKCSHHFHLGCIYEWMERSESCPVCGKVTFSHMYIFSLYTHSHEPLTPSPKKKKCTLAHINIHLSTYIYIHIFVYTHTNNLCIYAHVCFYLYRARHSFIISITPKELLVKVCFPTGHKNVLGFG